MFHSFENKEARRAFGGTAFIEIQYCKLKPNTKIKKILRSIDNWKDDSLYIYVDDIECFASNYADIFNIGEFDLYASNYFSNNQVKDIIEKIEKQKPLDYAVLLDWLKKGTNYNGIYILGI